MVDDNQDYEEESKIKKILKKTYVIVISLFLISLIFFSTSVGEHFLYYVAGRVVSSDMNSDYSFNLKNDVDILFDKTTFEALRKIYTDNYDQEVKVCLTGKKENKTYVVKGLYVPEIYEQGSFHVISAGCDKNTIISLHSHPPLRCIFSSQDHLSYAQFKQINPDGLLGLMCKEERFTFFGYQ